MPTGRRRVDTGSEPIDKTLRCSPGGAFRALGGWGAVEGPSSSLEPRWLLVPVRCLARTHDRLDQECL